MLHIFHNLLSFYIVWLVSLMVLAINTNTIFFFAADFLIMVLIFSHPGQHAYQGKETNGRGAGASGYCGCGPFPLGGQSIRGQMGERRR